MELDRSALSVEQERKKSEPELRVEWYCDPSADADARVTKAFEILLGPELFKPAPKTSRKKSRLAKNGQQDLS